MPDSLVEKVVTLIFNDFSHQSFDCDTGECMSYEYRTTGNCRCRESAKNLIALVREEAGDVSSR